MGFRLPKKQPPLIYFNIEFSLISAPYHGRVTLSRTNRFSTPAGTSALICCVVVPSVKRLLVTPALLQVVKSSLLSTESLYSRLEPSGVLRDQFAPKAGKSSMILMLMALPI